MSNLPLVPLAAPPAAPPAGATRSPFADVPRWRAEPYRIFFPLGGALAAIGVLPWLLFALGASMRWPREAHAILEVQGFLTCFAAGFLFTFVPRRLKSAAPAIWEQGPVLLGVLVASGLAWFGFEPAAHVVWAGVLLLIFAFAARRMIPAMSRKILPTAFAWIPLSLLLGVLGALAAGLAATTAPQLAWLGTNLVWQGLFGGLILGIGVLLLPVMTRRESWPNTSGPRSEWILHGALALTFFASFPIEVWAAPRLGMGLRGVVALVLLVAVGRIWRVPNMPGLHRIVAWISTWIFPLGFLGAALFPVHRLALLHLTFVGGFALLTLAVGNHVLVAHTGSHALLGVRPLRLGVFALAVVAATIARMLVGFDAVRLRWWLGGAAVLFIIGVLFWASWIGPRLHASRQR